MLKENCFHFEFIIHNIYIRDYYTIFLVSFLFFFWQHILCSTDNINAIIGVYLDPVMKC